MSSRRGGLQERWAPGEVVSRGGEPPKVVVLRDSQLFNLAPDPLRHQLGRARGAHLYLYPPPWREDVWLPLGTWLKLIGTYLSLHGKELITRIPFSLTAPSPLRIQDRLVQTYLSSLTFPMKPTLSPS